MRSLTGDEATTPTMRRAEEQPERLGAGSKMKSGFKAERPTDEDLQNFESRLEQFELMIGIYK